MKTPFNLGYRTTATGNGTTDDAAAIRADITAAAGKIVVFPAGTYLLGSSINLPSNAKLRGAGPTSTIFTMTAKGSATNMLGAFNRTGVSVANIGFYTPSVGNVRGFSTYGCSGSSLSNLRFENMQFGIKFDPDVASTSWTIADIAAVHCRTPMYIQELTHSTFARMNLDGSGYTGTGDHCIYVEGGVHFCTFTDTVLANGGGFVLQLHSETTESSDLTFNTISMSSGALADMVVSDYYDRVTLTNVTLVGKAGASEGANVIFHGGGAVIFDGFVSTGDGLLLNGDYAAGVACEMKNGTHHGSAIGSWSGVTLTNVTLI